VIGYGNIIRATAKIALRGSESYGFVHPAEQKAEEKP
jgi:hypothetical protein